jgi:hypothetical protein
MLGRGADEDEVMRLHHLGEGGVLGEKAVARVDRLGPGDQRGGDDGGHVEIGIARGRRADAHALIGETDMHGVGIGGGMHRDRGDSQFAAGAQHAQRDLAAIGDEDFLEHLIR